MSGALHQVKPDILLLGKNIKILTQMVRDFIVMIKFVGYLIRDFCYFGGCKLDGSFIYILLNVLHKNHIPFMNIYSLQFETMHYPGFINESHL